VRQRILIVEDDPDICNLLAIHARDCAAEVRTETSGARGLLAAQQRTWDLIVLDWLLPDLEGLAVCRRLRQQQYVYPIMMLTARTSELDHVAGLDSGADDYVDKPFGVHELKARIRAQLRRAALLHVPHSAEYSQTLVVCGDLIIDSGSRTVRMGGRDMHLTAREFDLLAHFARHPGRVYTRAELLDKVWGAGFEGYEHTVNSHINRLRAKIEADPAKPALIQTVHGVGYRLVVCDRA
jgi:DNA-binding response OmpR family regulator